MVTLSTKARDTEQEADSYAPDSAADTEPPQRAAPEQIGRYALRFELASGGMGSVYLARLDGSAGFEKLVALKRIHPHLAKEKDCIEMFLDEAKIASRITHPNVCSVFDFGEVDGEYFIAMEYLVGEPLSRVYTRVGKNKEQRRDPLLPLRMARIIADACEGLHAAHELKDSQGDLLRVVHRDVNPRNLFVTYDGAVQVVDFGLASARERLHKTSTGDVKGTIAYMAPEQLRTGTSDRRVDVWALGAALWEGLAVRRLFKRDTTANSMYALLYEEIAPPSQHRPQVPKELDEIALKALARDPEERWQSAREMGQALRVFLSGQLAMVGPAELSQWMAELFPEGEARKGQLMELARMQHAPVLSIPIGNEFEMTQFAGHSGSATIVALRSQAKRKKIGLLAAALATAVALLLFLFVVRGDSSAELEPPSAAQGAVLPAPTASKDEPAARHVFEPTPEAIEVEAPTEKPTIEPAAKARKPSSKSRARPKVRKSTKPGTVNLVTRGGWAEVFKNGKSLGSTPRRLTLPAGRHKLVLKPFGNGTPKRIFIEVEAGHTKQVSIRLP